ncbi:MAG: hypothetical protein OHK93_007389 [Ramalina farinacea]|uniref:Azaphilone pigments biosynthesis cluster protein L N-terminal domain-containing protein n=1 Tax=Ramalina farinacea TaxID=258253 RepID=A0AA43TVG9_9LECA|nr:hypothetical protein [Ramalina farinacea]
MSDPLSVAAGVIGIVTAAAQISSLLVKFTVKFKDAPRQASTVLTEVNDTSRILTQLEPFLLGLETPDQSRACHLHVESVIATLTGCVATFSELQQIVDSLELEDMQPNDRLKWSRNERAIATLLAKLKTHKDSLSLMLNVLNCSVDSLQESMRRDYLEIITRIRGLENQRASSSQHFAGIAVTTTGIEERSSGVYELSGEGNSIQKSLSQSSRKFSRIFEKDLALTRLYKKIKLRGSGISWFSTEHPETRWSTISDLSVADIISRLSVYELAITPSELHKSEQYTGDETEQVSNGSPDEGTSGKEAIVTEEAIEAAIPDVREARELQELWQFRDLTLPGPFDLPLKNIKRSLLPRCMESEGLNQWLFEIFELKEIYRSEAPSVVLLDYMANALKYFHQYRDMMSGRKPWLTIQPETLDLPASGYVDVTHMHLGQFVDGWLLHQELFNSHLFSDDTIQQMAFRNALYYYFLDPISRKSDRNRTTQFPDALSIEPVMLSWDGLTPDCSSTEHLAGNQIWRPAYR